MQAFGRTPLTAVSPKKTWEGALVGLGGCIAISVLLAKIFSWPSSILRCTFRLVSFLFFVPFLGPVKGCKYREILWIYLKN